MKVVDFNLSCHAMSIETRICGIFAYAHEISWIFMFLFRWQAPDFIVNLDLQDYKTNWTACWNFERKSAQSMRKSCKHARLANLLDQTFRNQVTQEYLDIIETWVNKIAYGITLSVRSTWTGDANMLCNSLRHTHTLYKYTLYTWRYYHVLFLLIFPTTHHPACNGKSTVHLCPLYTICNFLFCLGHEHNPTIVLVGSPTEALNAQYAHQ